MKVLVLLLTALLSTHVSAIPTPRSTQSHYLRRDENSTLLDLIAQYKQVKLQADKEEQMKKVLLAEAQSKKLEIEKNIGFINDSIISASTSLPAAKTAYSFVAETYTIFTAASSAVVFANQGTTRTVLLNPSSTMAPSSSDSAVTSNPNVLAISPTSTSSATSSFSSVSSISDSSSSASSVYTTSLALSNPIVSTISPTSIAELHATLTHSGSITALRPQESAAGVASPSTVSKTDITSGVPVTVLKATGSAIVLASQGSVSTMTLNVASSPSQLPGSG